MHELRERLYNLSSPVAPRFTGLLWLLLWALAALGALQACSDSNLTTTTTTTDVRIVRFLAEPDRIEAGERVTLRWQIDGARTATISTDAGVIERTLSGDDLGRGTIELRPVQTTRYVLDAARRGARGQVLDEARAEVTVEVSPPPVRPTVHLEVEPAVIALGESVRLSWVSTGTNSVQLTANGGAVDLVGKRAAGDTILLKPDRDTLYHITATGRGGQARDTANVEVTSGPRIVTFGASEERVIEGESVALAWQVDRATSLKLTANDEPVPLAGRNPSGDTLDVTPAETTVFRLVAENDDGVDERSVQVEVVARPRVVSFAADRQSLAPGESTTLRWEVLGAEAVVIEADGRPIGTAPSSPVGELRVAPAHTTLYELVAHGASADVRASATVEVLDAAVIERFDAVPARVGRGEMVTLRWETRGAEQVRLLDPDGQPLDLDPAAVDGELAVLPAASSVYRLDASGPGGNDTAEVRVTVDQRTAILDFAVRPEAIALGDGAVLSWQTVNADEIELVAEPGGPVDVTALSARGDTITVRPGVTTTWTLLARQGSSTASATTTLQVFRDVTITSFEASDLILDPGDAVELRWQTLNAATVRLFFDDQALDVEPNDGLRVEGVQHSTTFLLVAEGIGGPTQASLTVEVGIPPRIEAFEVQPADAGPGEPRWLSWRVHGARAMELIAFPAQGEPEPLPLAPEEFSQGRMEVRPEVTTTWGLVATNTSGSDALEVVGRVVPAPVIRSFAVTPTSIDIGQPVTLQWEMEDVTAAELRWRDVLGRSGRMEVAAEDLAQPSVPLVMNPEATTTFTLAAANPLGVVVEASAEVSVTAIGRILGFAPDRDVVAINGRVTARWRARLSDSVTLLVRDDTQTVLERHEGLPVEGELVIGSIRSPLELELQVVVGGQSVETARASVGLRGADPSQLVLTEVVHDTAGTWVELFNAATSAVSLWDVALGYGPTGFDDHMEPLRGVAEAGECVVLLLGDQAPIERARPLPNARPLASPTAGDAAGLALWTTGPDARPLKGLVYGDAVGPDDHFWLGDVEAQTPSVGPAPEGGALAWQPPVQGLDATALQEGLAQGWYGTTRPSPGRCFGFAHDPGYDPDAMEPLSWPEVVVGRPRGPATGGNALVFAGWFPQRGLEVRFGGAVASCVHDTYTLACTAPPGPLGAVDVVITGIDGEIVYQGLYTFEEIDACTLVGPVVVSPLPGGPRDAVAVVGTPLLYLAEVRLAGRTNSSLPDPGLEVQWGFGPLGVDPAYAASAWAWSPAAFEAFLPPDTHRFATIEAVPTPAGLWSHAFRVRASPRGPWTYCDADGTLNADLPPVNLFETDAAGVIDVPP